MVTAVLVSKYTAIIPIGNSCLTGFQLRRCKKMIEEKFGETFTETSSFFQWIFQDSRRTHNLFLKFIARDQKITTADIAIDPRGQRWPYLLETGSYFCHDGLDGDGEKRIAKNISDEEEISNVISKYNYLINKMKKIQSKRERIFIISNTDLGFKELNIYLDGTVNWEYGENDLKKIVSAINFCYPKGKNRILFVANEHNVIKNPRNCEIHVLRDSSGFFGDNNSWDDVLSNITNLENRINNRNGNLNEYTINGATPYNFINQQFVKIENNLLKINGRSSTVLWGPYVRLSSGFYEATIKFNKEPVFGEALFRVTSDSGKKIETQCQIDGEICKFGYIKSIRFNVEYKADNVETCIVIDNIFSGSVEEIKMRRISN